MSPRSPSGSGINFSVASHVGFHEGHLESRSSRGFARSVGGVAIASPTQEPVWGPTCSPAQVQVV